MYIIIYIRNTTDMKGKTDANILLKRDSYELMAFWLCEPCVRAPEKAL
jgi:hypothetical protein